MIEGITKTQTDNMKPFDVYTIFDIEIEKAKGSTLWDNNGNRYLDFYGGHAVISVGHSHPEYVNSISAQLNRIGFYSNSVKISQQYELAEKLGQLSGYNDYNLFLCNSGAEANENALKLASFHNGRKKIIAFDSSFHGRTSLAVAATDNTSIIAPVNANQNVIFLPMNDLIQFKKELDESICAVIIEGIQGVAGVITPETNFLQEVAKSCKELGVVLILDEVQSGFGRTGKFFAHQYAGIKPDIITVAKGMGNGFPVGGVLINPKIQAKKEMLGTTFGGNYLACVAAISVLDIMKKENLIGNAGVIGEYLIKKLAEMPQIKEVRGRGLMIGIELYGPCYKLRERLLFEHHIFTGSSKNKNTIRLLPSLTIDINDVDEFIYALKESLKKEK